MEMKGGKEMTNLITINEEGKCTARELYDFLELNPTQFSRWTKSNILDNAFAVVKVDFEVLDINVENPLGGRPSQDYLLAPEFAKKLCMLSKTERGEQARNYFIEVERRFKAATQLPDFTNPVIAARAWADAMEGKMVAEKEVKLLSPKAAYYDFVLRSEDLIPITTIAKDYGKSAVWMNKYLHNKGIQYKQSDTWVLYQKYADKGYTGTKTHAYTDSKKEAHTKVNTCWTQKGRLFIYELLKKDGVLPTMEKGGWEK